MTEVPKYKPTDAGRARNEVPKYKPVDAGRARNEVPKHKPVDAGRARNEAPKHKPTDADRAINEIPKHKPMDAGRAVNEALKCEPTNDDPAIHEVSNYEPTDAERAVLDRQAQRQKERTVAPRLKVVADWQGVRVELDHPDQVMAHLLLKEALGTADDDFCLGLLAQLYAFVGIEDSAAAETELNYMLSSIINGKPKDEQHATHLFQMAAGSVMQAKMLQNFSGIQKAISYLTRDLREMSPFVIEKTTALIKSLSLQQDNSERGINRLARTYSMQFEASERYRRSGEPSTTVHVAPGGQAIVGNVTHATPRTALNNPTAAPRALTDQRHTAMPIIDEPARVAVPLRRRKKGNDQ